MTFKWVTSGLCYPSCLSFYFLCSNIFNLKRSYQPYIHLSLALMRHFVWCGLEPIFPLTVWHRTCLLKVTVCVDDTSVLLQYSGLFKWRTLPWRSQRSVGHMQHQQNSESFSNSRIICPRALLQTPPINFSGETLGSNLPLKFVMLRVSFSDPTVWFAAHPIQDFTVLGLYVGVTHATPHRTYQSPGRHSFLTRTYSMQSLRDMRDKAIALLPGTHAKSLIARDVFCSYLNMMLLKSKMYFGESTFILQAD